MRDLAVTQSDRYTIDIDVINGYPVLLKDASMTPDQRAALSAVMTKGTIPGMLDIGTDWTALYRNDVVQGWIDVDNQVKRNIQSYSSAPDVSSNKSAQYYPVITESEGKISITVINTGVSNG